MCRTPFSRYADQGQMGELVLAWVPMVPPPPPAFSLCRAYQAGMAAIPRGWMMSLAAKMRSGCLTHPGHQGMMGSQMGNGPLPQWATAGTFKGHPHPVLLVGGLLLE